MRRPLGGTTFLIAASLAVARVATAADSQPQSVFRCRGLEKYSLQVEYHVDAGAGSIKSKVDSYSVALALGPMVGELVSEHQARRFSWIKTQKIGKATLRYGLERESKQLQATITDGPLDMLVDLIALSDVERFTSVARAIAAGPCELVNARK